MNKSPNAKIAGIAVGKGSLELLFLLPFVLPFGAYTLSGGLLLVWLLSLPICYGAGSLLLSVTEKLLNSNRATRLCLALLIGILLSDGLLVVCGAIAMASGASWEAWWPALAIFGSIAVYRGMNERLHSWSIIFTGSTMMIGIFGYLALQLAQFWLMPLQHYSFWMTAGAIVALMVYFFMVNERLVQRETDQTGQHRPISASVEAFKRQNRWMLALLLLPVIAIGFIRQITQGIEWAVRSLVQLILSLITGGEADAPAQPQPEVLPEPVLPPVEQQEPSPWLVWIEGLLKVVIIIIVIAAIGLVLFWLMRVVYRLSKAFLAKMAERSAERLGGEQGYTDEVESLMTLSKWQDGWRLRRKRNKAEQAVKWEELSGTRERIRYLYSRWVKRSISKGYVYQPHLTPRETAEELVKWQVAAKDADSYSEADRKQLINLYEEARYKEEEPQEEAVNALYSQQQKHGK
ncbi:protein of unknown function [Paenibacillus algorifonticola]|uniref:Protein-glutamine gamma-glutamyltransferase-like C-terminal domain-containing protein n=1 Tax=Paenibacillus algorifonticola TaxID=684063 RepID=A0A1I2BPL0_9BACL|nr:DUF4129 domain-containing protein [Paenibacillus algorifonticola]SFE57977.1 protein of unknown function [Paenibacillus algorifonticola]